MSEKKTRLKEGKIFKGGKNVPPSSERPSKPEAQSPPSPKALDPKGPSKSK